MKYDDKHFAHMPALQYDIQYLKIGYSKYFINSALYTLRKQNISLKEEKYEEVKSYHSH